MAKMGRPQIEINQKIFESLCTIQCTEEEICSVLGCTEDTLNSWCKRTYNKTFSDTFSEKRQGGRASLRRSQWKLAEKNPTMSIWLGKQYLGQKDSPNEEGDSEVIKRLDEMIGAIRQEAQHHGSGSSGTV